MIEPSEYCRQLEAYLCRKNEGHLIRIVGPVFERVCGWAAVGVPLTIAFRGVDQYCQRYYAKGPRRRPVRIEFCEADILELFDDWRRAVGVTTTDSVTTEGPASRDRTTLPAHVDRVIARLTAFRAGGRRSDTFDQLLDATTRELDLANARAKQARGEGRAALITRLAAMDRVLIDAAIGELSQDQRAALEREAEAELAPFASRMTPDTRARAAYAAFERLVRDALGLPVITFG
jgi:hypothetical protein